MRNPLPMALAALLAALPIHALGDDFAREGGSARAKKDALEGRPPPALAVSDWMNTEAPLDLASLRGKVVVLDFWGTW